MKSALERILTEMIPFMANHPEHFEEAATLALSDRQPLAWRAAWLLHDCIKENDARLHDRVGDFVDVLGDRPDGHQRELLKILLKMEVGEDHEGRLFDVCVSVWERPANSPSVRITALKHILTMARKYPELANEITGLVQDRHLESLSPGVMKSVSRMLRDIKH